MAFTAIYTHFGKRILFLLALLSAVIPAFAQAPDASAPLKQCWTSPIPSAAARKLLTDAEAIYTASSDGKLRAVRAEDGVATWTAEIGGEFSSNIFPAGDDLLVVSNTSGATKQSIIRSISKLTGVARWRSELPFSEKYYLGGSGAAEIAAVGSAGFVLGVSLENGKTAWQTVIGELSTGPSFRNGNILVGTVSKRIRGISQAERGKDIHNIETKFKPTAVLLFDRGDFAAGDERGNIYAYHSSGSIDWRFKNGASISHLTDTSEGVLAASNDNFVYMLTDSRGGVIWKRRLSGRIALEPVATRDSIFTVTYGDGRGYLISLNNGKIVDQVSSTSEYTAASIASFADGRIVVPTSEGIALFSISGCTNKVK